MEIADAARKYGIADFRHRARGSQRDSRAQPRGSDLYIRADRAGRLLEVVVLDDDGQPVAIHAMVLRRKFHDQL